METALTLAALTLTQQTMEYGSNSGRGTKSYRVSVFQLQSSQPEWRQRNLAKWYQVIQGLSSQEL